MIVIDHLTKHYDRFSLDLSLNIPRGRVTGIVGKNGAGKSTTIKAILGLVTPDSGSVLVFGKEASMLTGQDKVRIGVSFAESGFSSMFTLDSIIKILEHMYPAFDKAFFLHQAEQLSLPMNKPLKEFSTGMKAKVRVLTAISHRADLLILDEPTAGLDVLARNELLNLLRNYMDENDGRSILISSHISSDLEGLCDDIYLIDNGRAVLHENMTTLLSSYAVMNITEEQYAELDKTGLLAVRKNASEYACLTNQKQYYLEAIPGINTENASIDELLQMLVSTQTGG